MIRAGRVILGILYIPLLMSHFILIRQTPSGVLWIFFILVLAFAGDIAAYYVGRRLGKRKLLPEVSPGKTVEGTIGLVAGSIAGCSSLQTILFPDASGCACRDSRTGGKRCRAARGSIRVGAEKGGRGQGFRHDAARSRGDPRPAGLPHVHYAICLLLSGIYHSMKQISLLGSTGSIGVSTLDVVGSSSGSICRHGPRGGSQHHAPERPDRTLQAATGGGNR